MRLKASNPKTKTQSLREPKTHELQAHCSHVNSHEDRRVMPSPHESHTGLREQQSLSSLKSEVFSKAETLRGGFPKVRSR